MISNPFNFPSVDHLVEGRDYRIVDWSFADGTPVEKQKPEETVQPNQQNAPAQAPQPAAQAAPPAQAPTAAPAAQEPPQTGPCKEGERSVFGVCRKVGGNNPQDEKDFDSSKKSDEEKAAEAEAKKQGSDVKNNKPVMVNGKKMGWAVKNGKPVMVEWASVAGAKPAPKAPPQVKGASGGPQPLSGRAGAKPQQPAAGQQQPPAAAPKSDQSAKIAELQQAMKVPGLPPAAQKALQNAIDLMGA